MGGGQAGGGQHGSAEGERESEDGMLPLDHLERDAEIVEDGHGSNVSVLSSQWSERKELVGVVVNVLPLQSHYAIGLAAPRMGSLGTENNELRTGFWTYFRN